MRGNMLGNARSVVSRCVLAGVGIAGFCHFTFLAAQDQRQSLQVKIDPADGNYAISESGSAHPVLKSWVAVKLDGRWLESKNYPKHVVKTSRILDDMGAADEWEVDFSGLPGEPDLAYRLRAYPDKPFADIQVFVRNSTLHPIHVESIRSIEAEGSSILELGAPPLADRVLSDSFSEDRPGIKIHDLSDAPQQIYRGVGSQLLYNRQSHRSFFVGALTSERFLTVLRLHVGGNADQPSIAAYEVDSTGTTELTKDNSLRHSPPYDQVLLKLPVSSGADLASERLLLSVNTDYHRQLNTYGSLIRQLHSARVAAPTAMGWWSWTAYYFGLNEGTALTNAQWLAQHLKPLGYDFFHIDEGYQYARGEYSTPDATLFPHGMARLEHQVQGLGLVPGIWTAPFEVSERSYVYQQHPSWLVHNAKDEPIPIGWVSDRSDRLFVLDCTNPGAQDYLRKTYSALVNRWKIRYIKMDFMEDSGIEGYYYRPNTTAMEAQRIGLAIIRQTVGNSVLLDKDGSVMLNPVGYVDFGRISQDTGHTFSASKEAASGIAARYYMNRNFFVADPDAFSVSTQTVGDQPWHGGKRPLTPDEAKVSIVLAAVSGGMYEIGDDLPTLGSEPERLALVQNQDLIDMVRTGRSSIPVDLMTYRPEDEQPSIFMLKEDRRQSILTIFNWSKSSRSHMLRLSDVGLDDNGSYTIFDILDRRRVSVASNALVVNQPAHSVRVLKIINTAIPVGALAVHLQHPSLAQAGKIVTLSARPANPEASVITYRWNMGDGVILDGSEVSHAYTQAGIYQVTLTAHGPGGIATKDSFRLRVIGSILTKFVPMESQRYQGSP